MFSSPNLPPKEKEEVSDTEASAQETERLLDDAPAENRSLLDDFEIIVDTPPDLHDQIAACIAYLEEIKLQMSDEVVTQSLTRKIRIYGTVGLIFAMAAVATPTLLFTLLKNVMYESWDDYAARMNPDIVYLRDKTIPFIQADVNRLTQEYRNTYSTYLTWLGDYYEAWRGNPPADPTDLVCEESSVAKEKPLLDFAMLHGYNFFCEERERDKDSHYDLSSACWNIVNSGCQAAQQHRNTTDAIELAKKAKETREADLAAFKKLLADDLHQLESSTWLSRVNLRIALPVLGASLVTIAICSWAAISAIRKSSATAKERKKCYQLDDLVAAESGVHALIQRLDIKITPEMSIDKLIRKLKKKAEYYKQRRDARVAFLCAGKKQKPGSLNDRFFKECRHQLPFILKHAGLLPGGAATVTAPANAEPDGMTEVFVEEPQRVNMDDDNYREMKLRDDQVNLRPLMAAIRNRDTRFIMSWCEQGYLLSWPDHATHKTLLEHLGEEADFESMDFVIWFYKTYFQYPDMSDAVRGAAAANRSVDEIFAIKTSIRYCEEALQAAQQNGHYDLVSGISQKMIDNNIQGNINYAIRAAAINGNEAMFALYLEDIEAFPNAPAIILEGLVIGRQEQLVEKYLRLAVEDPEEYQNDLDIIIYTAARSGNSDLVMKILSWHREASGDAAIEREITATALLAAAEHGQTVLLLDMMAHAIILGMDFESADSPLHAALNACLESQRYSAARMLIHQGAQLDIALVRENTRHWSDAKFMRMFRGIANPFLCFTFARVFDADAVDGERKIMPLLLLCYDLQNESEEKLAAVFETLTAEGVDVGLARITAEIKHFLLEELSGYMQQKGNDPRTNEIYEKICILESIESIYQLLTRELERCTAEKNRLPQPSRFARFAGLFHRQAPDFSQTLEKCLSLIEAYRYHPVIDDMLEKAGKQRPNYNW